MLYTLRYGLVLSLSLMMSGCITLIGSPSEVEEPESYSIEHDGEDVVLDPSAEYDLSIVGDQNKISLKGNTREILITGSYNYVIIEEDTHVNAISITGMNNIVMNSDEQTLFVEELILSGSRNVITLDGYDELLDSGEDNQVLNTGSIE